MFPQPSLSSTGFAAVGARQLEQVLSALRAQARGCAAGRALSLRDCYWLLAGIVDRARRLGLARFQLLAEAIGQILGERRFAGLMADRTQCDVVFMAVRRLTLLMEFHAAGFHAVGSDRAIIAALCQWIEGACPSGPEEVGMGSGPHRAVPRGPGAARRTRPGADGQQDLEAVGEASSGRGWSASAGPLHGSPACAARR